MASQDQKIDHSTIQNSSVQQVQAGRDAVSFLDSPGSQVIINNTVLRLFGTSESSEVDWDSGKLLLKKQLPNIRQRLTDTLGRKRIFMDVAIAEQLSWVNRPPLEAHRTLLINGEDCGILDPNKMLIETFGRDDIEGKLLILGAPGSGKTTALLSLAEQLVCGALAQPKTVIPVLFELSTWRDDNQSIHDWLIEQLYVLHEGNRKRKIYEQWLERQILLPLLDGLDELGLERQRKCTDKLNEFAHDYHQLVVCCRAKEFETVNIKLRYLRGAVCLQPLSDGQIEAYLHSIQRPELWSAMQTNPNLQAFLETTPEGDPGLLRVPLFVKLTADVYDPNEPIRSKKDLVEKFIERQLSFDQRDRDRRKELERRDWAYKTVEAEPQLQETISSLSWIARQLQANNTVELLIEQMQPSWIESKQLLRRYRLIVCLVLGLIIGGLNISLIVGLKIALFGEVIVVLTYLLLGYKKFMVEVDTIKIARSFQSSKLRYELLVLYEVFDALPIVLVGIFLGAGLGMVLGIIVSPILGLYYKLNHGILFALKYGLIFGISYWMTIGASSGSIFGFIYGLSYGHINDFNVKLHSTEFIEHSLKRIFFLTVFIYPLCIIWLEILLVSRRVLATDDWPDLYSAFSSNTPHIMVSGLLVALLFSFSFGGGTACLKHLCLRIVLWQSGTIPWNFARFLNYCVERRLLLRIGGRYRFLHREILDNFAQSDS